MPPKEKKKKLSKKEKEALKKAEMERLAEEQRLAEAAEAERQEKERLRREEEARVAAQIAAQKARDLEERRVVEDETNAHLYDAIRGKLEVEQKKLTYEDEWAKYVACHTLPDVQSEAEVNTYMTEWGEAPMLSLEKMLRECERGAEIMWHLAEAHALALHTQGAKTDWQLDLLRQLGLVVVRKLDEVTADILVRADELANHRQELQCASETASLKYALWVNHRRDPRNKSASFPEVKISVELPKPLVVASVALRIEHLRHEHASPSLGYQSAYQTVGGVIVVDLLALPPATKKVKGWTLRQVTQAATTVQRQAYPIPPAGGDPSAAATVANAAPLGLTVTLPDDVIIADKMVRVGWWDAENKGWSLDGVSEIRYDSHSRQLSFRTVHLTALAVLQHTHAELPYKRWLVTPYGPSRSVLALQTQRYLVVMDTDATGCCLREPRLSELEALLDVRMPPAALLGRLHEAGINLRPADRDAVPLHGITPKEAALEKEALPHLARLTTYFRMASSKWNASRSPSKVCVRITNKMPTDDETELLPMAELKQVDHFAGYADDGWVTLLYSSRYAAVLQSAEADSACALDVHGKEEVAKGHVAHSTPLDCFREAHPEMVQALTQSSAHYQSLMQQLLGELRVLSFSAGAS